MKLIRDLIPEDMRQNGYAPKLAMVHDEVLLHMLVSKLREETTEVSLAIALSDRAEIKEELADLLQLIKSIGYETGIEYNEILTAAKQKEARRGAFTKGYVWLNSNDQSRESQKARRVYKETELECSK